MPGIGSTLSRPNHPIGHGHPQARESESCQSACGETITKTGQRSSANPGARLAPHSRLDHAASVRVSGRERNPTTRGLHTVWLNAGFMLFLYPEFAEGSR